MEFYLVNLQHIAVNNFCEAPLNQGAFFLLGLSLTHNYNHNEKNITYRFSSIVLLQLYGTGTAEKAEPATNPGGPGLINETDEHGQWLV